MKTILVVVAAALVIASCGPSADPMLQSKVNVFFNKSSMQNYPPSNKDLKPMPYAVGQYVVIGMTKDNKKSILKISVVGKEQGGWIFETYSLTESNEGTTQMLLTGMERVAKTRDLEDLDIVWVKTKQGDEAVQSIDGPVLALTKGMYRKGLGMVAMGPTAISNGGSISVPAGTFAGTIQAHTEVEFLGGTYSADSWFHSSVPINGMVRSVSDDKTTVQELLEFGTSGATRSF